MGSLFRGFGRKASREGGLEKATLTRGPKSNCASESTWFWRTPSSFADRVATQGFPIPSIKPNATIARNLTARIFSSQIWDPMVRKTGTKFLSFFRFLPEKSGGTVQPGENLPWHEACPN